MNKYKLRKFKCIGCGKEVEARRPKNKTNYCSLSCYRNGIRPNNKTGKIIACKNCGKETYIPLCRIKDVNFCSTKCANEYQGKNKVKFICKICGEKFSLSKSKAEQSNPTCIVTGKQIGRAHV